MKHSYIYKLDGVRIADAYVSRRHDGWMLDHVNVHIEHRGQGHGRRVLQMVLDAADERGIKLFLCIAAGNGLTYEALDAWYRRHGFKTRNALVLERMPRRKEDEDVQSKQATV